MARVLIVEDENIEALDLEATLQSMKHEVVYIASHGEEAINKSEELNPDIILMDILLRGNVDGIEAAKEIKKLNIPLIYLTAHSEKSTLERVLSTEPYGYLLKPYNKTELKFSIELALYKKKMEKELKESEERLRLAQNNANIGLWDWYQEKGELTCSPELEKIYGLFPGTIRSYEDWRTWVHPEDIKRIEKERDEALATNQPFNLEYRILLKSGEIRWINAKGRGLYDKNGLISRVTGINIDITEQKKVEEALKKSEQRFKTVADFTYDWEYWVGSDGTLIYVSPSCERITGFKTDEFKKDPNLIKKITHPDDFEIINEHLCNEPTDQQYYDVIEYRIINKQGEERWIGHGCQPVCGDDGTFLGRRASNRDITEQKKLEEELQHSNEWLGFVQRAAKSGFWDWDMVNGRLTWSPEFYDLFGLPATAEASFDTWFEILHPDDRETAMDKIKRAIEDRKFLENEYRVIRPDGKQIWVKALGSTFYDDSGNLQRISGICRDITKSKADEKTRKEAEERYHALYSSMSEGVALHDIIYNSYNEPVDYMITDVNPAYENITGLKRSEVIGKKASELYGTGKPPYIEIYARVAEKGSSTHFETHFKHVNKYFYISVTSPAKGKFATFFEDITERKRDEEKLILTMDELRRSNIALEQFAYVASHDLQEPLRMVSSFSQLLERRYKDRLDADAEEFIMFIVDGSRRMKQLIDDLLVYSQVTSQAREFKSVDLEKVLNLVFSNLSSLIEENNAIITHDSLPTIIADSSQMVQVFQNLIANAIKFRGQMTPEILISVYKDGNEWKFAVRDNGIGIDPKHQEHIFQVFKRLHTREEYPGTGIGLSICQKIIERHGGQIWVESIPGKGSTFYFTIPQDKYT